MNEILKNIVSRRSVRAYTDQPVPEALLTDVLTAGAYAPSGMGLQGWRFTVAKSDAAKAKINAAVAKAFLAMEGMPNPNPFIAKMIEQAKGENPNFLFGAPVFIILSNDAANGNAMADCALAAGNMMLCAHSLGLGSCWINQIPMFTDAPPIKALLAELGVPEGHKACAALALGYPAQPLSEAAPRKDGIVKIV